MVAFILVLSVFVLGAGVVFGAYLAFTKLPGYLAQRKLDTRLSELSAPGEVAGSEDGADLVKFRHAGPLPGFDQETVNALVTAAHAHGRKVVAHASRSDAVAMAQAVASNRDFRSASRAFINICISS